MKFWLIYNNIDNNYVQVCERYLNVESIISKEGNLKVCRSCAATANNKSFLSSSTTHSLAAELTTHHTFIIYSGIDICTSSIYIHFNQCNAFATQIVGLNGYTSAELRLGMSRNTHICSLFQLHTINSEDMSVLIVPCLLQSAKMGPCGKFSTKFSLTPDISSIVNGK